MNSFIHIKYEQEQKQEQDFINIKSEASFIECDSITESETINYSNYDIFHDCTNELVYTILQYEYEYELFLQTFIINKFKNSCITTSGNCKITYM